MYVDDIVLIGNDDEEIRNFENSLANEFEIKWLCSLKHFMGIEVVRLKYDIFISQRKYIIDFLNEIRMLRCKAIDNLIEVNVKFSGGNKSPLVDKGGYQ